MLPRGCFIYPPEEAKEREVTQIGVSACGATSLINTLIAFDWKPLPTPNEANEAVCTRLRKLDAPTSEFLLSRYESGATHEDLIRGMDILTSKDVVGQFYHMYPSPPPDLYQWMVNWMKMGGVMVASLNPQQGVPQGQPLPDAWHHQMIYGVITSGVFTLNPHEYIPFHILEKQLCSESVIKIKANDIVSRWRIEDDIDAISQGRWAALQVPQRIYRLLYNIHMRQPHDSHVTIPAAYKSGITVFGLRDSEVGQKLLEN